MPWIQLRTPALTLGASLLLALVLSLTGCTLTRAPIVPPTATPTPSPQPAASVDGWETIRPGVERRTYSIRGEGLLNAQAVVVRLDPALVSFRVAYSPGEPRSLNDWRASLPGAAVIVNGGFFDEQNRALGLVVSDGQVFGQSFRSFGGMFQVDESGPRVRSLVSEPYAGEPLWHAIQSFPMLIETNGVLAPQGDGFNVAARRTIIAQDGMGRLLLAITPLSETTFSAAQRWLLNSDLDVRIAFALDGGRSSGLFIDHPDGPDETYPAFDRLPSVIAVFPR